MNRSIYMLVSVGPWRGWEGHELVAMHVVGSSRVRRTGMPAHSKSKEEEGYSICRSLFLDQS
jgi:hypothetical protein